ncbi:hypothetical protein BJ741DRAFT_704451 [Chytriomyces cf. hyalinus JEL632]|nr:hypothetical protein BJ741DRAFT_704451 [Chytriomyces cf. hyalinus JEL632]
MEDGSRELSTDTKSENICRECGAKLQPTPKGDTPSACPQCVSHNAATQQPASEFPAEPSTEYVYDDRIPHPDHFGVWNHPDPYYYQHPYPPYQNTYYNYYGHSSTYPESIPLPVSDGIEVAEAQPYIDPLIGQPNSSVPAEHAYADVAEQAPPIDMDAFLRTRAQHVLDRLYGILERGESSETIGELIVMLQSVQEQLRNEEIEEQLRAEEEQTAQLESNPIIYDSEMHLPSNADSVTHIQETETIEQQVNSPTEAASHIPPEYVPDTVLENVSEKVEAADSTTMSIPQPQSGPASPQRPKSSAGAPKQRKKGTPLSVVSRSSKAVIASLPPAEFSRRFHNLRDAVRAYAVSQALGSGKTLADIVIQHLPKLGADGHRRLSCARLWVWNPETFSKIFICPACEKSYSTSNGLKYHLAQHATEDFPEGYYWSKKKDSHPKDYDSASVHVCPVQGCTRRYTSSGGLRYHLVHMHNQNYDPAGRVFATRDDEEEEDDEMDEDEEEYNDEASRGIEQNVQQSVQEGSSFSMVADPLNGGVDYDSEGLNDDE